MKLRALFIIVVLAVALPWPAAAVTREELVCPVREDWGEEEWERWEEGWSKCPCERGWKPTEEQLREILDAHERWVTLSIQTDTSIPGHAVLCRANLQEADLMDAKLQKANLREANLQKAGLRDANLQNGYLVGANLQEVDFSKANLQEADLSETNLQEADLWKANLQGADLIRTNLQGANLWKANLQEVDLGSANLQKADLRGADLQNANLWGANLREAELRSANLQDAYLRDANLQKADLGGADIEGARLANANLTGAIYAPASPPPNAYVEGITGLASVIIPYDKSTRTTATSGMVQLRELLRAAGLRERERQATSAIERHKALHAREHGSTFERIGGWLQLVFFEWTTGWGLYPARALGIVMGLAVLLGLVVYPAPIVAAPNHASARHGIFQVWTAEEYGSPLGRVTAIVEVEIERLSANVPKAFLWGLWFSFLSAFHIGWRDLNVGTWLSRVQPFPFALRARGWVRVVSGAQSLISVYLVAMWVLTYFGRPFQ